MAFKMKGSAFKLGNVATKSALKDTKYFGQNTSHDEAQAVTKHNKKHKDNPKWGDDHSGSVNKMKSPMKDTNYGTYHNRAMEADKKHKASVKHDASGQHAPTQMKSPLEQNIQQQESLKIYEDNYAKYDQMSTKDLKQLLVDEANDRGEGMTESEWDAANSLLDKRLSEMSLDELTGKVGTAETPAPAAGPAEPEVL